MSLASMINGNYYRRNARQHFWSLRHLSITPFISNWRAYSTSCQMMLQRKYKISSVILLENSTIWAKLESSVWLRRIELLLLELNEPTTKMFFWKNLHLNTIYSMKLQVELRNRLNSNYRLASTPHLSKDLSKSNLSSP